MEQRTFGRTGISVPALTLGSWHTYSRLRFRDAVGLVEAAVDLGVTSFQLGRYHDRQDLDVVFARLLHAAGVDPAEVTISAYLGLYRSDTEPEWELDELLDRMDVESLDLVLFGEPRGGLGELQHIAVALGTLVAAGRIRGWGGDNWSQTQLEAGAAAALRAGVPGPSVASLRYSVARRAVVEAPGFAESMRELGVSVQAANPFEGGLLAGRAEPDRHLARDAGDVRDAIRGDADAFAALARRAGLAPAQLALAFVLANPLVATVLFGATTPQQLRENVEAVGRWRSVPSDVLAAVGDFAQPGHQLSKTSFVPALPINMDPYWLLDERR